MNIFFEYNDNEKEFVNKINSIKSYIDENKDIYKMKVLSKVTSKSRCDLHIIVSNDLNEIYKYAKKIEDKSKVLIITSNIQAAHVLGCIDITLNITYLKNENENILKRISDICEKNKN